jgi:hypothetical protein
MKRYLLLSLLFLAFACQDQEVTSTKSVNTSKPKEEELIAGYRYWYFFRGESSTTLRYAYSSDGVSWFGNGAFNNGAASSEGPGAVYFNGRLHCVFKGASTSNIYYCYSDDGVNWSSYNRIGSISTNKSPEIVIWKGQLYVFYVNTSANGVYYVRSDDGSSWTSQQAAVFSSSTITSGVAAEWNSINNDVGITYSAGGIIRYAIAHQNDPVTTFSFVDVRTCDGSNISNNTGASFDYFGKIAVFVYPESSGDLKALHLDDCGSTYSLGARSSHRPSVVSFNGMLTVIFKSKSDGLIRYAYSYDGVTWYGNAAAAGDTANSPCLVRFQCYNC